MLGRVSLCECVCAKFIHQLSLVSASRVQILNAAHCAQHQQQQKHTRVARYLIEFSDLL